MSFKVYLAGPIAGLTYDDAQDWRSKVKSDLLPDIHCYSPLRSKQHLRDTGVITLAAYSDIMASDRGIMTRDHFDCMTSDLIFVNLLGTERISVGTVMELAFAHAYRKPLVVAMEPAGNLHDHPMVRQAIDYRVSTLAEAVAVTRAILLPS